MRSQFKVSWVNVLDYSSGNWNQINSSGLISTEYNFYGRFLDLNYDGSILALTANDDAFSYGEIQLFQNINNTWQQMKGQACQVAVPGFESYRGYFSLSKAGHKIACYRNFIQNLNDMTMYFEVFENESLVNLFSLYPNPVDDFCQVNLGAYGYSPISIKIYDVSGNLVLDESTSDKEILEIDFRDLEAGIYVVTITTDNFSEKFKVSKN